MSLFLLKIKFEWKIQITFSKRLDLISLGTARGRENSRCDHLTWVLVFFFFLHSTSTFTRRYVTLSRLGFLVGEGVHGGDVWRGDTRAKWRVHASAPFFALALLLLLCCAAFARGCGTSLKNLLLFELLLLLLLL